MNGQACAITSDQPYAVTLAESHALHHLSDALKQQPRRTLPNRDGYHQPLVAFDGNPLYGR